MTLRSLVVMLALSFSVFFSLPGAWALQVTPAGLTFNAMQGGTTSTSQTLSFSRNSKRQLNWASSDNATWLSVTPTAGTITLSDQAVVSVNPTGLAVGVYAATVTITLSNGRSRTVPVTLIVASPPAPTSPPVPTSPTSPPSPPPATPPAPPTPPTSYIGGVATLTWAAGTDADPRGVSACI